MQSSPYPRRPLSLHSDKEYILCFLLCPRSTISYPFEQSLLLRNPVTWWHLTLTWETIPLFFFLPLPLTELNCKCKPASVKELIFLICIFTPLQGQQKPWGNIVSLSLAGPLIRLTSCLIRLEVGRQLPSIPFHSNRKINGSWRPVFGRMEPIYGTLGPVSPAWSWGTGQKKYLQDSIWEA
jgi:hypothetical protein